MMRPNPHPSGAPPRAVDLDGTGGFARPPIAHRRIEPITIDRIRCDLCGTCAGMCPPDAISLDHASIHVDEAACTLCMKCVPACPVFAISGGVQ